MKPAILTKKVIDTYRWIYANRVIQSFFGNEGYCNFGYWTESTSSAVEACNNLVDKLLAFIPCKERTILDVACGQGGTTKRLMNSFGPTNITAINISEEQISVARSNAPGCRFLAMDAARLGFDDETFDHVICVEAVFHFQTREGFLKEANRVLKPGGYLVLSDIIYTKGDTLGPPENYVVSLDDYKDMFMRAGFEAVTIVEARQNTWESFRDHFGAYCKIHSTWLRKILLRILFVVGNRMIRMYLLVSARKPFDLPGTRDVLNKAS